MPETNSYRFEEELTTFNRHLPEWQNIGGFVLVKKDAVLGPYKTEEEAIKIGYDVYGVSARFMVRAVTEIEPIETFYQLCSDEKLIPSSQPIDVLVERGSDTIELSGSKYL